jgi:carboxyl-terminal processing protease
MKKMTEKRTILLMVMILTVVTTGVIISILLKTLETEAEGYKELQVFKEALTIVQKSYVEDVESRELIHGAIKGMVGSFDAHSDVMTIRQRGKMQIDSKGVLISKLINTSEAEADSYDELKAFKDALTVVKKNLEENIQPKDLVYGAIHGMMMSLDPHSDFMTPEQYTEMQVDTEGEFGGIGIKVETKEGVLTVMDILDDTPAFKAGIKEGDKIIKINNESTKNMRDQDAVSKMRGATSTTVKVTVHREGWKETKDFTMRRETITISSVKAKMLGEGLGYIKIHQFQRQTASEFSTALAKLMQENMKALILDLRNNPGGLLYSAVDVTSQLIPSEKLVVYTKDRNGKKKEYINRKNSPHLTVPMVVIVNDGSASASEIVAGALKDWNRATVIGTVTYGKGSVQTVVPLKDGSALTLTTAKYYTPKGISIQATGILPDIPVTPRIKKGQPVRPVTREKDLERHFSNGKIKQTNVLQETVPVILDEETDVQLQSAIKFLKGKMLRNPNLTCSQNVLTKPCLNQMPGGGNV